MMAVMVTVNDLRAAGMCARAARPWFVRHGLSWQEFISPGINATTIRATGDVLAFKVVAIAEARAAKEAASE